MPRASAAECDVLVIGAGVVGLAIGRALADKGTVLIVEKHRRFGEELSTRNSGVIHAGLYYPPESAKAYHCVRGNRMLYAWCASNHVKHARTSKLVVARTPAEVTWLEQCTERARSCGVDNLLMLSRSQLLREEPTLRGNGALRSPSSGLVDSADFVRSLSFACRERGVNVALRTEVVTVEPVPKGWQVTVSGPQGHETVTASRVVNAAGLAAADVARKMNRPAIGDYRLVKGSYFRLRSGVRMPRTALVYPAPAEDGLGVHLTHELGGSWIAGPDTEVVAVPNFDVDQDRAGLFATDVARMLPGLRAEHLEPYFASVRPKLGNAGTFADFKIEFDQTRGAVHLVGIESPGLTAALSIAATVAEAW